MFLRGSHCFGEWGSDCLVFTVFYQNDFTMFPKNQITFSNTVLTDEDIEGLIKRYNDASLYERQAINNEPLMRKLKEKGIIIEKEIFE